LAPGEVCDVGRKLVGRLKGQSWGMSRVLRALVSVEFELCLLVESHQRPRRDIELNFVCLHDVERSQPVAPLVFDQRAVGAVELFGKTSESDSSMLPRAPECRPQNCLGAWLVTLRPVLPGQGSPPLWKTTRQQRCAGPPVRHG